MKASKRVNGTEAWSDGRKAVTGWQDNREVASRSFSPNPPSIFHRKGWSTARWKKRAFNPFPIGHRGSQFRGRLLQWRGHALAIPVRFVHLSGAAPGTLASGARRGRIHWLFTGHDTLFLHPLAQGACTRCRSDGLTKNVMLSCTLD